MNYNTARDEIPNSLNMGWGEPRISWLSDHKGVVGNNDEDMPTGFGTYPRESEAMWRAVWTEIGFKILRDMGSGSFDSQLHCKRGDSAGLCASGSVSSSLQKMQ
jgi:hypothetical protein